MGFTRERQKRLKQIIIDYNLSTKNIANLLQISSEKVGTWRQGKVPFKESDEFVLLRRLKTNLQDSINSIDSELQRLCNNLG